MEIVDLTDEESDPIRSAIQHHPDTPAGARLRRLIILTEWVDEEGYRWVGGFSDCSPWEGEGILRWALRQGLHIAPEGEDDLEGVGDEDDFAG